MTIKILELFSGYGTASFALKRLNIPHEIVGYSDIDKYANQCFQQNHGGKELGDVRLINPNELEDFDLLTGGFPCQSFSNAGKMQGELDSRGTLFNEIIRIAEVKQPKYMLLEKVKGLTCKKFKDTFNKILSELDRIGYNVYWKVLNSKDYGIPQSRARVWFVCFRKDLLKESHFFEWPKPVELKIFIKDILEPQVDSKYYLSEKLQERFKNYLEEKNKKLGEKECAILDLYNKKIKTDGTSITLSDPCHNNLRLIESLQVDNLQPRTGKGIGGKGPLSKDDGTAYCIDKSCGQGIVDNLVYEAGRKEWRTHEGESPTLKARMGTGGNNVPMILGYTNPQEPHQSGTVLDKEGVCNTLYAQQWKAPAKIIQGQLRRLTPKECFRLMGFLNDEINLEGLSDTQKYKLAGNGQDVNMVSLIFKEMFK